MRGTPRAPRAAAVAFIALVATAPAPAAPPVGGSAPSATADFVPAAPAEPFPGPLGAAVAGITAQRLAAHVAFLAAPAMAGRGLGSRGLDVAAQYAAASLALAGIPPLAGPAGDGAGYFQTVPLREFGPLTGGVTVAHRQGDEQWSRSFGAGTDCQLPKMAPRVITAPAVFAGYGIREAGVGRDDYLGLDVHGKVVVVLAGVPPGEQWRKAPFLERYAAADTGDRWRVKARTARELGAAAVIAVESQGWPPAPSEDEDAWGRFFLPFASADPERAPLIRVSHAVAETVLAAGGAGRGALEGGRAHELPGALVTIEARGEERAVSSRNVLGVIAGTDPQRASEAIVLGAHLDHLGESGGKVYPGADDNASGVAALLEIARAFASAPGPPRRAVVIAFWTGEEEGKLGSGHYVRAPRWPLAATVAYLNLDMIGHPWSAEEIRTLATEAGLPDAERFLAGLEPADFVEPGLPPGAAKLEEALRTAARGTGLALHLDRTDGTSGGSDYRDFARAGVPFIRFFGNFFPGYHQPEDTAEKLDARQVERVARLALATAWLLANP